MRSLKERRRRRGREKINYQQKSILQQNTNFNYLRFSSHALSISLSLTHSRSSTMQKCKWEWKFTNFLLLYTPQLNKLWSLISPQFPFRHLRFAFVHLCMQGATTAFSYFFYSFRMMMMMIKQVDTLRILHVICHHI